MGAVTAVEESLRDREGSSGQRAEGRGQRARRQGGRGDMAIMCAATTCSGGAHAIAGAATAAGWQWWVGCTGCSAEGGHGSDSARSDQDKVRCMSRGGGSMDLHGPRKFSRRRAALALLTAVDP